MTPAAKPISNDEEAVRGLYQYLVEGWNQASAEVFASPFSDDADFVAFDGSHFTGRRKIAAAHRPLFAGVLKGTHLIGGVKTVRFLSNEVAIIQASGAVVHPSEGPSPDRDSIQTLVAVKRGGQWLLTAFHNTRVRPISHNAGATLVWMLTDLLWKLVFRRR